MAVRLLLAAALVLGCTAADAQQADRISFSPVETDPDLGRLDYVLTVADFNGDGRDDILAGGRQEHAHQGQPEDRYEKTALEVFFGQADGTFDHAADLIDGTVEARQPVVVAADFNNDELMDFAVFDAGVYVFEERVGYGNPPQLWLSDDGVLRSSDALAEAVRAAHAAGPSSAGKGISAPGDLHLKSVTSGDIDGDGDSDLWVDSVGGKNVDSHFIVNNGDGTFTVDEEGAPPRLRHNDDYPPDYWYHIEGQLVDLDNDDDLDLSLGQNRHTEDPAKRNTFSIVLLNDGTGNYPERIELPPPAFNDGYTWVRGQTHFDVNADGLQDLLLVHTRNVSDNTDVLPGTGRYIQTLINDDGAAFVDETSTRMGDQSLATQERLLNGDGLRNEAVPRMLDIDRDGCEDIVMANGYIPIRSESPIFYLNNGSGQFRPVDPDETFTGLGWAGSYQVPADVNGDGVTDLVFPQRNAGPDDLYDTDDDSTRFLTLLNTTPAGPARCSSSTP